MSYFVAIEGIDGSGKGTQTVLLQESLTALGIQTTTITFPRYSETLIGRQIGRFLDGQFGELDHLHPVPISLMYAAERYESRQLIKDKLASHQLLIADRYVGSNLAHQGARQTGQERNEFLDWMTRLEYDVFGVPEPNLVIVLDLPAEVSAERVAMKKARDYTKQVTDLHESNQGYLKSVRDVYLQLCEQYDHWHCVNCLSSSGTDRSPEEIHQDLQQRILEQLRTPDCSDSED